MLRTLFKALLAAAAAALGVIVIGVRTQYPPVVGFVRRTLRDRANPGTLAAAGGPGQSNGIIVHEGRRSGRAFRTPVTPMPLSDGYVIALPYGPESDWVLNVLAAGSATLITNGEEVPVDQPEVRPLSQYVKAFTPAGRLGTRIFGATSALVVHRISD